MSDSETKEAEKIVFKPKIRRHLRQRKQSSDDDKDEEGTAEVSKLEETKERQKLRKKQNGVNIVGLALGKKMTVEEEFANRDPYNIKGGGMVNMQALKSGKIKTNEDAYDTGIGTQFSAETNKRDEDEEMMKYIEEQLSKKKGINDEGKVEGGLLAPGKYMSPEEAALMALPAHLRLSSTQKSEEMLSNQMLSGIPEVDLGIEAKIKNIEATEEAKLKYLQEQKNKKDAPSHFVPSNMAVNFVQHNRFKTDDHVIKRKITPNNPQALDSKGQKKATDDYHFDKFKKQFRRH